MTNTISNVNYINLLERQKSIDIFETIYKILNYTESTIDVFDKTIDSIDESAESFLSLLELIPNHKVKSLRRNYSTVYGLTKTSVDFAKVSVDKIETFVKEVEGNIEKFNSNKEQAKDFYYKLKNSLDLLLKPKEVNPDSIHKIESVIQDIERDKKNILFEAKQLTNFQIEAITEVIEEIKDTNTLFGPLKEVVLPQDKLNLSSTQSLSSLVNYMLIRGKSILNIDENTFRDLGLDSYINQDTLKLNPEMLNSIIFGYNAPAALAFSTGVYSLVDAIGLFRTNQINEDDFINLVTMNSIDTAGVILGSVIGQIAIPIPLIGPILGATAAKAALDMGKSILNYREIQLLNQYNKDIEEFIYKLDEEFIKVFQMIKERYEAIDSIQTIVFDVDYNIELKFKSSIDLAIEVGVDHDKVLKDIDEIDDFFLN